MLKRKFNAGLTLLVTFLILAHAIALSVWILSKETLPKPPAAMAWVLVGATVLHALISIDLVVSTYMDKKGPRGKSYAKMNCVTILQRVSGVLMLLFIALHIAGATGYMQPPKVVHAIVPAVFYTIVLAHVAVSASKALITLGIGNAKFIKAADVAAKVICAATLITALTSFYLYRL